MLDDQNFATDLASILGEDRHALHASHLVQRRLAGLVVLAMLGAIVSLTLGQIGTSWFLQAAWLLAFGAAATLCGQHTGDAVAGQTDGLRLRARRAVDSARARMRSFAQIRLGIAAPAIAGLAADAAQISADAATIADSHQNLAAAIAVAQASGLAADMDAHDISECAEHLAGAIGATTLHIVHAADIAACLAGTAFAAARAVGAIDARLAPLNDAIDTMHMLLDRAAHADDAAGPALHTQVAAMGRAGLTALATMQTVLRGLREDATTAETRCQDLSRMVSAQHEVGDHLAAAVVAQGEEVASIAHYLQSTRSGVSLLRRQVDLVAERQHANAQAARDLRDSASTLPARADAIATVLSDAPGG